MSARLNLGFTSTEIAIILNIFEKRATRESKVPYLYSLQKELHKSPSTILENLEKLRHKGLVAPLQVYVPKGVRAPTCYYDLTYSGEEFARVIATNLRKFV